MTAPAQDEVVARLLDRLKADGGRYLLSIALTSEERDAEPVPTYGGRAFKRWLTEEELSTLIAALTALAHRADVARVADDSECPRTRALMNEIERFGYSAANERCTTLCWELERELDAMKRDCPTAQPAEAGDDHSQKTITGLCDRLDKISVLASDGAANPHELLAKIAELSGGFMPIPPSPSDELRAAVEAGAQALQHRAAEWRRGVAEAEKEFGDVVARSFIKYAGSCDLQAATLRNWMAEISA